MGVEGGAGPTADPEKDRLGEELAVSKCSPSEVQVETTTGRSVKDAEALGEAEASGEAVAPAKKDEGEDGEDENGEDSEEKSNEGWGDVDCEDNIKVEEN